MRSRFEKIVAVSIQINIDYKLTTKIVRPNFVYKIEPLNKRRDLSGSCAGDKMLNFGRGRKLGNRSRKFL